LEEQTYLILTIAVPPGKVAGLYAYLAEAEVGERGGKYHPQAKAVLLPWGSEDCELFSAYWPQLSDAATAIYTKLADLTSHGSVEIDKLAMELKTSTVAVRAGLSWPSTIAAHYGRQSLHMMAAKGVVDMPSVARDLVRKVNEVSPPIAGGTPRQSPRPESAG
jgi:hypothetical protein